MPQIGLRHSFEMPTRNAYTKVDAEVDLKLNGKELPNTAVLGEALDKAVELIEQHIADSYKTVPERDGTTPHGKEPQVPDKPTPRPVPQF